MFQPPSNTLHPSDIFSYCACNIAYTFLVCIYAKVILYRLKAFSHLQHLAAKSTDSKNAQSNDGAYCWSCQTYPLHHNIIYLKRCSRLYSSELNLVIKFRYSYCGIIGGEMHISKVASVCLNTQHTYAGLVTQHQNYNSATFLC